MRPCLGEQRRVKVQMFGNVALTLSDLTPWFVTFIIDILSSNPSF